MNHANAADLILPKQKPANINIKKVILDIVPLAKPSKLIKKKTEIKEEKKPENKSSISINSTLTAVWHMSVDNGDSKHTNLYLDKSLGHSTANFDRTTCRPDDRQWEKCMDFSFPVQGARSF